MNGGVKLLFSLTLFLSILNVVYPFFVDMCPDKSCPENEVFSECGSSCQTECATLNQECNIYNIICPCGCYCIDGYARDSSEKCIPQEQCESTTAGVPLKPRTMPGQL